MAPISNDDRHLAKQRIRFICLLLPLAAFLLKAIDAYLHCDQTVEFFTADLAASVALILAGILLLVIDSIYSKHGPRGDAPSKRRIAYTIFQFIMALAIFGTGYFCAAGNMESAIVNGETAAATTDDAVQRSLKDNWRMDPFNVCKGNNQTRIVEVFRLQPEVFRSTHRAATLFESVLLLVGLAMTGGLPLAFIVLWKCTQDELESNDVKSLGRHGGFEPTGNLAVSFFEGLNRYLDECVENGVWLLSRRRIC